ncbi:polysaccharide pyruvyl transferase family protein [Pseudoalteromonas gelatinilytica]
MSLSRIGVLMLKSVDSFYQSKVNKDYIPVKYFNDTRNWGDELNHYLVEKITGKKVIRVTIGVNKHLLGIGSVLRGARNNSVVWGSGFIQEGQTPRGKPRDFRACRGPLTWNRLNELGFDCPKVFGDPGLLIKKYYDPDIKAVNDLGFVPHYTEKNHEFVKYMRARGCKIIDIQQDIEPFVDDVKSCKAIISSSLHGLIAADAYGIPNRWVRLTEKVLGGRFKFDDYHLGIGTTHELYSPSGNESLNSMIEICEDKNINFDSEKLLSVFPFESFK